MLDVVEPGLGGSEQGLLGLAFDATGQLAYINYTDVDGNTIVEEHAVDDAGTFATEARRLLQIEQPYSNHNGGDLVFGPDGLLYIGMGDGGARRRPGAAGHDPAELLGKLLRIDPDPTGDEPYTIPPDNPFVGVAGTRPEIWSTGFATRGGSRSTARRATCGSPTSARTRSRRSTSPRRPAAGTPARACTSAGARLRARSRTTTTSRRTGRSRRSRPTATARGAR